MTGVLWQKLVPRRIAGQIAVLIVASWILAHVAVALILIFLSPRHPMIERLDDGLFRCNTAAQLYEDTGSFPSPGRYTVRADIGGIVFTPLEGVSGG